MSGYGECELFKALADANRKSAIDLVFSENKQNFIKFKNCDKQETYFQPPVLLKRGGHHIPFLFMSDRVHNPAVRQQKVCALCGADNIYQNKKKARQLSAFWLSPQTG